jgi:hypothetical protein
MQLLQDSWGEPWWRHWHIIAEPATDRQNLLEQLYAADPVGSARNAHATVLQLAVLNAYASRVPRPTASPYIVMERSPWRSLAVFLPVQDMP